MKSERIVLNTGKYRINPAGFLLFLSGFILFMGIISGEIFYNLPFNTRSNYISELAAALPPATFTPPLSAGIFNTTMIVAGLMIMLAGILLQGTFARFWLTLPIMLFGLGFAGVGVFPGNIAPWHLVFAFLIFVFGGIGAILSGLRIKSLLGYLFIVLGLISIVFLLGGRWLSPVFGVGGQERWLLYPEIFWITGLGAYLCGTEKNPHKNTH